MPPTIDSPDIVVLFMPPGFPMTRRGLAATGFSGELVEPLDAPVLYAEAVTQQCQILIREGAQAVHVRSMEDPSIEATAMQPGGYVQTFWKRLRVFDLSKGAQA